jgi:hypothetical protein
MRWLLVLMFVACGSGSGSGAQCQQAQGRCITGGGDCTHSLGTLDCSGGFCCMN